MNLHDGQTLFVRHGFGFVQEQGNNRLLAGFLGCYFGELGMLDYELLALDESCQSFLKQFHLVSMFFPIEISIALDTFNQMWSFESFVVR
jgi:hypothetical protein